MRKNSIIPRLLKLAIVSTLAFSFAPGTSSAATQCKNALGEYGMYYYKEQKAKSSAVGRWEKKAAIKHGIGLSFWKNAKTKSNVCKKQANNTYRCFAIGTPCQTKKLCKPTLKKHGMWYTKKEKAKSSAIGRWEKQAAIHHSVKYSFWNNAKTKSFSCKKHQNNTWRCEAIAKPCH